LLERTPSSIWSLILLKQVLALEGNLGVAFSSHTTTRSPGATGELLGAVDPDVTAIVVIAGCAGLFRLRMGVSATKGCINRGGV
jgi:hypothetical protein